MQFLGIRDWDGKIDYKRSTCFTKLIRQGYDVYLLTDADKTRAYQNVVGVIKSDSVDSAILKLIEELEKQVAIRKSI